MSRTTKHAYEFGPFRLDTREHILLRDGESVPLTLKSFKTLLVLVENSGHLVERSELLEEVWPNTFVEEANLTQQVFTLRKILGAAQNGRQFIETVPKLGYRFAATVTRVPDVIGNPAVKHQPARMITEDATSLSRNAIDSIAVLPMVGMSNDPDIDYLGDSIAESIISRLSELPRLRVKALSTVSKYKGTEIDPQDVGRELNVRALVTGRITGLDDSLILWVELVDVTDGSQLFGKRYRRRLSGIFEEQGEISRSIARELQTKLTCEKRDLSRQVAAKQYNAS